MTKNKKYYYTSSIIVSVFALFLSTFAPAFFNHDKSSKYFIQLLTSETRLDAKQLQHAADFIDAQNEIISGSLLFTSAFSIFVLLINSVLFFNDRRQKGGQESTEKEHFKDEIQRHA